MFYTSYFSLVIKYNKKDFTPIFSWVSFEMTLYR